MFRNPFQNYPIIEFKEPADAVEYGTLDADLQRIIEMQAAEAKNKADKEKKEKEQAAQTAAEVINTSFKTSQNLI